MKIATTAVLAAAIWASLAGAAAYAAPVPASQACTRHVADHRYGMDRKFEVLTATTSTCHVPGRRWVITIHGGSWINGSRDTDQNAVRAFWDHGWQVFNIEYRRGPDISVAYQIADVARAYDWIVERAGRFGIDPAEGSAYGFSAGGHLAAWLGNRRPLSAVVTVSGVLQPQRVAGDDNGARPITEPTTAQMHNLHLREIAMMGCDFQDPTPGCSDAWTAFTPQAGIHPGSAPMYMVQGDDDPAIPLPTPDAYSYWLGQAGVRHQVAHVPGYGHTSNALFANAGLRYTVQHWMVDQY